MYLFLLSFCVFMDYIHNPKLGETVSLNEQLYQMKEQQECSFTWRAVTEEPESVLNATSRSVNKQQGPYPSGPILWWGHSGKD